MADRERIGLDSLSPPPRGRSSSKRVGRGRGSGRGKTAGRGHKGQKSRSGAAIPAWFEGGQMPLYRRTPKRGFKPPHSIDWSVVNVGNLGRIEGSDVDPHILREHGLVRSTRKPVKILARGEVDRAFTVRAHAFSATAREKIEAAGGSALLIE